MGDRIGSGMIVESDERRVMELMAKGLAPSEIAKRTGFSVEMVHDLVVRNWKRTRL